MNRAQYSVKGAFVLRRTALFVAAIVAVITVSAIRTVTAQRLSPHESVAATIDGANLSLSYGRPYMRGRAIFGSLVPYGRVWCPGADEATTLTTSRPLKIGDLALDAGSYTLWILPTANDWSLVVNRQTGIYHTDHSARFDIGSVPLAKRALDQPVEQLTFSIEPKPSTGGGSITMTWEATAVSADFTVQSSRE
jgi:hypothetical protein